MSTEREARQQTTLLCVVLGMGLGGFAFGFHVGMDVGIDAGRYPAMWFRNALSGIALVGIGSALWMAFRR